MPYVMGIDHRFIVIGAFSVSTGVAIFSTYKWLSEKAKRKRDNVYESEKLLNEYLVFHYGAKDEILKYDFGPVKALDFPKRCADLCLKHCGGFGKSDSLNRALDIGCAVGRSSFELKREFQEVIGIDYSQSFVDACTQMRDLGEMVYFIQDEGDLVTPLLAKVDPAIDRNPEKLKFEQGDACDLRHDLGSFGCVLAANLICRLHEPFHFLNRLTGLVAPGGILVITSPYTWLQEFTDRSKWLGGYEDKNKEKVTGFSTLKKELGPRFDLVEAVDMPFFIRETARKNQWTVAHATVWKRKL
ncbi:hypothetical protein FSP39_010014 [Pinctada imbricata]|uniref:Methyltransferase type 12 domain-containing protein n=1 Tax=Pinctada imbricata TaxID=66713 RepID=A0AA89BZ45_PINIB|nr:hypothetical protein FSP39_010014 [Pinctada imbricata]